MIRPYVAVILDSFHAAFASRILWVAFLAIWIVLGCLAPIGYREDFTTTFRIRDFENGTRMKAMLASSLADPASQPPAVAKIAQATPQELQRQLERVGEGDEVRIHLQLLADALNDLLDRDDWYDEEAWRGTTRLRERRELESVASEDLDLSQRRRLARLRIEAALPGVFESRSARSILLTYAGWDFPASFAIDKTQFAALINQWVVPTIINWLLGFVVIFLGILVTASIVPDMLEPGSLHLLLSKPVSRTMLLLSKFAGGCVFVFLCVTQLVVGLWLIAGWRLDVWNARMLWCIPVSVFLFAVFYSVSVLAGLRWRSPILAIGITCIFGAVCLTVGVIGGLFDTLISGPARIRHLAVSGNEILASTAGGGLIRFDAESNRWVDIFASDALGGDRVLAPVALPGEEFLSAHVRGGRFNPFGSGSLDLLLLSAATHWEPVPSLRLPTATVRIERLAEDRLLAMNADGLAVTTIAEVRRAAGEPAGISEESESDAVPIAKRAPDWIAKLSAMMGGATAGFDAILPSRISLAPPRSLAVAPQGEAIFVATGGRLFRLVPTPNSSLWTVAAERDLEGELTQPLVLACGADRLFAARLDEPWQVFDAETLELVASIHSEAGLLPVRALSLGDRPAFALVAGDGGCRIVQASPSEKAPEAKWQVSEPLAISDVEAIQFDPKKNQLLVVHHVDRVDVIGVDTAPTRQRGAVLGPTVREIRPALSNWRIVDRYVIAPLRMVIPQTGELGETVAAIVSGQSSVTIGSGSSDEEPHVERYRILRPVLSCSLFVLAMLSIGCYYFATRDF